LPIIGWTRNNKNALTKRVIAKIGRAKGHLQDIATTKSLTHPAYERSRDCVCRQINFLSGSF
jgi:hypothetical protein